MSYALWVILFRHYGTQATLGVSPLKGFLGIFYGIGVGDWMPYNIALWFFTCLFITEIIFFFIVKLRSKSHLLAVLIIFSVAGYLDTYFNPPDGFRLPWNIDIALTTVVFLGIGFLSRDFLLKKPERGPYFWLMLVLALLVYASCSIVNDKVAVVAGVYGNYFLFYGGALAGILFWTYVCMLIPPSRLLARIGANTLVIFPMHLLVFPFLTAFQVYVLHLPRSLKHESILLSFAYAIISILVLLPVASIIDKYFPFILGKPMRSKTSNPGN